MGIQHLGCQHWILSPTKSAASDWRRIHQVWSGFGHCLARCAPCSLDSDSEAFHSKPIEHQFEHEVEHLAVCLRDGGEVVELVFGVRVRP